MRKNRMVSIPNFINEPLLDFSDDKVLRKIKKAVQDVRHNMFRRNYFYFISGGIRRSNEGKLLESLNPSNISEIVGYVHTASFEDVDEVAEIISKSTDSAAWARASFSERGICIKKIAQLLRENRFFFIALMMLEVGKTAQEADGEVCEAIDFCEMYADAGKFLLTLDQELLVQVLGEHNSSMYQPYGFPTPLGVSIQPWNFPLAISIGPLVAGLVTGHAMIYKPSEYSPVIGFHLARLLYESGIPKDVFHFLPGGAELGAYMVSHPAVRTIAFTGSLETARNIERAVCEFNTRGINSLRLYGRYPKRIAALETGGKNAIIICPDADPDKTILGVSKAVFGYSGQKCSACSRLIFVDHNGEGISGKVLCGLRKYVENIIIGPADDLQTTMGPLISKEAYDKFCRYTKLSQEEGRMFAYKEVSAELCEQGYFAPPMIVRSMPIGSPVVQEEIFGPLLVIFQVGILKDAIELANRTGFGLTGGVFSENPDDIQYAAQEMNVGNFYINRKNTGAEVGKQPFGGWKCSGNGTKAGAWDYLLNFVSRKNICEAL